MELLPLKTAVLKEGDDLARVVSGQQEVVSGDIVVISSKAVATVEGAMIDLSRVEITEEAREWGERMRKRKFGSTSTPAPHDRQIDEAFRQAVLDECRYWNGRVLGGCPNAMLTELRPEGMESGGILVANAGLDRSNIQEGWAIGWPREPVASVSKLRRMLRQAQHDIPLAIILSDSCCRPRRIGVTAIALTVSGIDPLQSNVGKPDLFGRELCMTQEAVADQLATAANMLMGNSCQGIPAVIVRGHRLPLSDFEGWVPGIEAGEDLFVGML